jgi:spore maturation protein CgeB
MKKTVLLACPFDSTFKPALNSALKELGYTVSFFDYRNLTKNNILDFFPQIITPFSFYNLLKQVPSRNTLLNKLLVTLCQKMRPTYLFVVKGENISEETVKEINQLGIITILWQVDATFHPLIWQYVKSAGPHYIHYVACEPEPVLSRLHKAGFKNVHYMLGAAERQEINPWQKHAKIFDIVLVGSYDPMRERYIYALKGFDVHIWGWGNWQYSSVSEMFEGSAIPQKEMLKIYSQAKIVINTGRNPKSPIPTNLRPFEAAQVGAFILVDWKPQLKSVFKLGTEIDSFKTPQELRKKVLYYLKYPNKRERIARAMRKRVLNEHTYTIRLQRLFAEIEKLTPAQNFGRNPSNN